MVPFLPWGYQNTVPVLCGGCLCEHRPRPLQRPGLLMKKTVFSMRPSLAQAQDGNLPSVLMGQGLLSWGFSSWHNAPPPNCPTCPQNHCWQWPSPCLFGKLITCERLPDPLILVNPRAQCLPWNYKLTFQNLGGGGISYSAGAAYPAAHKRPPLPSWLRKLTAQRPTWNFLQILKGRP